MRTRPSFDEIAELSSCSKATVDRVLHGRPGVHPRTREKVNNAIAQLGDNPNAGQRANNGVKKEALVPGAFCCPHGATWDHNGNIYVAEWLPYGRVTKLRHVEA